MTKSCLTRRALCLQVCGILLSPVLLLTFSEVPSSLRTVTGTPTIYEHSTIPELDTHLDISGAKSLIDEINYVTIPPCTPQKTPQSDDATKAADLKRRAHDIARESHRIEDEIRAMVSSYMAPNADEDQELAIGRLVR